MTNLFADPIMYTLLASRLQALAQRAGPDQGLRAWVAGCSTGEDAYSVAILLNQVCAQLTPPAPITVFATATDPEQLAVARAGVYPAPRLAQLPPEQRERLFFPSGGAYHVKAALREQVVFAAHRLLDDPPFSRLDLVLCRELFVALSAEEREEAQRRFAFALRPGGLMLLGDALPAEIDERYFRSVAPGLQLYARTAVALQTIAAVAPAARLSDGEERLAPGRDQAEPDMETPHPMLISDGELRIVELGVGAERFLRLVPGAPSYALLEVIQPQLRPALVATLDRARARRHPAESLPVPVTLDGRAQRISVVVQPLSPRDAGGDLLVFFVAVEPSDTAGGAEHQQHEGELPPELVSLQAQHDVVYEELRVANEELYVSNEELQALAEELETRREELLTLNEQLQAVNGEQQRTLADLLQINADLENLIGSTAIGTLFLDRELRLQRSTSPVEQLFNLLPSDISRPLAHLTHELQYPGLIDDAARVLAERKPLEREVPHQDGRWFLARLRPYYSAGQQVTGVVLAFLDISERRETTEALRVGEERLRIALDAARLGAWDWHIAEDRVLWNAQHYELFGLEPDSLTPTVSVFESFVHPDDRERVRDELWRAVERGTLFQSEFRIRRADGVVRWMSGSGQTLPSPGGPATRMLGVVSDISERKQREAVLRQSHDELERRVAERTAELMEANAARQALLRELVAAQEAERLRLARELHDTLGQQITAILLGLQAAREQSQGNAGALRRLEEVGEIVQAMGREMHEIAVALRPTALDDVGLAGALQGYVEGWSRRTGVKAELFVSGVEPKGLPPEIETTLYRVVQEALTNVARHARASQVSVILQSDGSRVVATIEDDGRGFDVDAATAAPQRVGHLGLLGMQERAVLVGGTLTIESQPAKGATVIARIPVPGKKGAADEHDPGAARR